MDPKQMHVQIKYKHTQVSLVRTQTKILIEGMAATASPKMTSIASAEAAAGWLQKLTAMILQTSMISDDINPFPPT